MRCLISWLFFDYPCVVRGDWRDLLDLLLFQRLLSLGPPPLLFCLLLPRFAPCLRSLAGLYFFCLLSGFALCLCSFSSFGLFSRPSSAARSPLSAPMVSVWYWRGASEIAGVLCSGFSVLSVTLRARA